MDTSRTFRFRIAGCLLACACAPAQVATAAPGDPTPAQPSIAIDAGILDDDSIVTTIDTGAGSSPLKVTLKQAMQAFDIPGVGIAVVDRDAVAWARGYGTTAPGGATPVTPVTLFQAASISKPVTAAGALWLVERGKLDLDGDVNARLTTWKVPDNAYTAVQKVTLRRLMSHSAGINVHGFAGYARDAALPTLAQILDGLAPANSAPIRVVATPGGASVYSGGGVTIERLLMMEASGEPFATFMQRTVLGPAGMTHSTFAQPLPAEWASRAATATRIDGRAVAGGWHVYPEEAADGLWTTPTDLATFAIEIARAARGESSRLLSQRMARDMLTQQATGADGAYGLGFALLGTARPQTLFGHGGANEGFQSRLLMAVDGRFGIALMGNSDAFESLAPLLIRTIAQARGVPLDDAPAAAYDRLSLLYALRGLPAVLQDHARLKKTGFAGLAHGAWTLNLLGYRALRKGEVRDAIALFALNVAEYPKDANAYDSLAEAYAADGRKTLAIRNYARSLALDPGNDNARERLKMLRSR